jgi:hypothetical protein
MDPRPEEQAVHHRAFSARANVAQGKQERAELVVAVGPIASRFGAPWRAQAELRCSHARRP